MKTSYLILVFTLITTVNSTKAQYQSIFGNSQTSWNIIKGNLWGTGTDSLVTTTDTVVNNIMYKKVNYYDLTSGTPQLRNFLGFIREDTTLGKAWYFNTHDTTEQLIMDLSLNLGDTFYVGGPWNSSVGFHPVDSIWFALGKKHIRIDNLIYHSGGNNNEKVTFIEGVGTNIGIGYQGYYVDNFPYLLCSHKDGLSEFQNNHSTYLGVCFYTTVGINDYINNTFNIYPNPIEQNAKIEVEKSTTINSIYLFNLNGKKIKSFDKTNTILNLSDVPKGQYILKIETRKGVISEQIIKK